MRREMSVKETVRVVLPPQAQTLPIGLRIGSFGAARVRDDVGFAHERPTAYLSRSDIVASRGFSATGGSGGFSQEFCE
jgi:hypothetical protein